MNTDEFQHIAPYEDEEIPAAIQRVLDNPLLAVAARKLNPDEDIERVRSRTAAITTADDYQRMVMFPLLMHVLNTTSAGLTTEGFELLERDKSYLFVSNHRDISLDAALFTMQLLRHNLPACEIAFGDNLLANSLVAELARINRMFPILRGGTRKELYNAALLVSRYIRHVLLEKHRSVWIAQRNGRTKNGDDRTEPGLLKMFAASSEADFVTSMAQLNIVPVAISYEIEPCAESKVREQMAVQSGIHYEKSPDEDVKSVLHGILQPKGAIHITVCEPITTEELEECASSAQQSQQGVSSNTPYQALASLLDKRIYKGYHLHPSNREAYEKYRQHPPVEPYTEEDLMLKIYANPVLNQMGI